jgi:hypothetical protein
LLLCTGNFTPQSQDRHHDDKKQGGDTPSAVNPFASLKLYLFFPGYHLSIFSD